MRIEAGAETARRNSSVAAAMSGSKPHSANQAQNNSGREALGRPKTAGMLAV